MKPWPNTIMNKSKENVVHVIEAQLVKGDGNSLTDKLADLQAAKAQGLLTETEFANAKKDILASLSDGGIGNGSVIVSSQPRRNKVHPNEATVSGSMVLVQRGSPNELVFAEAAALKAGGAVRLTLASHPSKVIGRGHAEERRYGEWRYVLSDVQNKFAGAAIQVQLEGSGFLKLTDADLVLDVSFWKFNEGTTVNFVGGSSAGRTRLEGGGRSWVVNDDGTIGCKYHQHLVLGTYPPPGEWTSAIPRISTVDIAGKWACCCIPGGWACFDKVARGEDELEHGGCVCLFFMIPMGFGGEIRRRRPNTNNFYKVGDEGNVDVYNSSKCVCNGISCSLKLN